MPKSPLDSPIELTDAYAELTDTAEACSDLLICIAESGTMCAEHQAAVCLLSRVLADSLLHVMDARAEWGQPVARALVGMES